MCSVQCAVQTSGLDSTSTRLFRLLAPTDSDSNLVVVVGGGLEGWLFVPARAGQDRDLERQERGAFADMGKEHMGISAGGVAYQRSFFSRGVSPTGGSCLLPLTPSHPYLCKSVCVYILSDGIHLWWCVLPRLIVSLSHQLRCGWPGYTKALRPSNTVCLCNTAYVHTLIKQSTESLPVFGAAAHPIDAGLPQGAVTGRETSFPPLERLSKQPQCRCSRLDARMHACKHSKD